MDKDDTLKLYAKVLKEYCEVRNGCEGCPFYFGNSYVIRSRSACALEVPPQDWDLELFSTKTNINGVTG